MDYVKTIVKIAYKVIKVLKKELEGNNGKKDTHRSSNADG